MRLRLTRRAARLASQNLMRNTRTRPIGAWGAVRQWSRAHGGITPKPEKMSTPFWGFAWGMALVFGLTLGIGYQLLLNPLPAVIGYAVAVIGAVGLYKAGFLRTT